MDPATLASLIKKIRSRFGIQRVVLGGDRFDYRRDEEKIAAEAALDGLYVIRTSVPAEASAPLPPAKRIFALPSYGRTPRELKFAARCMVLCVSLFEDGRLARPSDLPPT